MFDWKFELKVADSKIELEDISGWFKNNDGGPYLQKFQEKYAKFCEVKHALAMSSGSASIYIALKACGVGLGQYVAVPAYTHVGSVAPIVLAGAKPVFIDVDKFGNIDPTALKNTKRKLKLKIDAVIAVHQLGLPCRMDEIKQVADGAWIIEDASHSLGAQYKGRHAGTLGDIGCFSIGGGRTKIFGVGEGGMITTNSDILAEKCKNIRNHGDRNTDVDYFCFNFRLSDLNAAIGYVMMDHIRDMLKWQIKNAKYITANLPDYLEVLPIPNDIKSVQYIIACKNKASGCRDSLLSQLKQFQIGPRQYIGGGYGKLVSDIKFYDRFPRGDLIMSNKIRNETIWIDYHRYPRTRVEIDDLLNALNTIKK